MNSKMRGFFFLIYTKFSFEILILWKSAQKT